MNRKVNLMFSSLKPLAVKRPRAKAAERLVAVWTITRAGDQRLSVERAVEDTAWNLPPHPWPGYQPRLRSRDTQECLDRETRD